MHIRSECVYSVYDFVVRFYLQELEVSRNIEELNCYVGKNPSRGDFKQCEEELLPLDTAIGQDAASWTLRSLTPCAVSGSALNEKATRP